MVYIDKIKFQNTIVSKQVTVLFKTAMRHLRLHQIKPQKFKQWDRETLNIGKVLQLQAVNTMQFDLGVHLLYSVTKFLNCKQTSR